MLQEGDMFDLPGEQLPLPRVRQLLLSMQNSDYGDTRERKPQELKN
jgi:hypothetical protein